MENTQSLGSEYNEPSRSHWLRSTLIIGVLALGTLCVYVGAAVWDEHRRILPNGYIIVRQSSGNCAIVKNGRPGVYDVKGRLVLDEYVASWRVRGDFVWGRVRLPPFGEGTSWTVMWYLLDTRAAQAQLFDSKSELRQDMDLVRGAAVNE